MKHRNATEIETVYLDGVKYARITPIRHPDQFVDIAWESAFGWLENYDMVECEDLSQVVCGI